VDVKSLADIVKQRHEQGDFYLLVINEETGKSKLHEFGQDVAGLVARLNKLLGKSVTAAVFYGHRWPISCSRYSRYLGTPFGVRVPLVSPAEERSRDDDVPFLGDEPVRLPMPK
jgi:hypothetical protein